MNSEEETEPVEVEDTVEENPEPESAPKRRPDYQQGAAGRCMSCG